MKTIYAFYLDIFLLRIILIDTSILILSFQILKIPIIDKKLRIILAITGAALLSAGLLLVARQYIIYRIVSFFILTPAAIVVAAGRLRGCLKIVLTTYLATIFVGGLTEALDGNLHAPIGAELTLSIMVSWVAIKHLYRQVKARRNIYIVRLYHMGKRLTIRALYDTGNNLRDGRGIPVSIGGDRVFGRFSMEPVEAVSYQSLGNTKGIIRVYEFERMELQKDGKVVQFDNVLIGRDEAGLLTDTTYDIILNEAIISDS